MKGKYKLIVFDLDGTLLTSDKILTPRVLRSIDDVRKAGLKITISTGRSFPSAKPYLELLEIEGPASTQNGALILSINPREIHRLVIFPLKKLRTMLETAKNLDLFPILFVPSFSVPYIFMEGNYPRESVFSFYFEKAVKNAVLLKDIFHALEKWHSFNELVVVGELEKVRKFIKTFGSDGLSFIMNSVYKGEAFLEVYGPGCSKRESLEFFSRFYRISLDQIIFVGDNLNDLDAIISAGLGVAMENAPDVVKESADLVIPSNENEGVASFLEKIIEENKVS